MNSLEQRRLSKAMGGNLVHVLDTSGPGLPPDLAELEVPCCMGAAVYGLERCTCWEPIYDLEQTTELQLEQVVVVRTNCCDDCAYRNGSPERTAELGDELLDVAGDVGSTFACHKGMRRVVRWRHPGLGDREIEAGDGDYRPPIVGGVAYRADGRPADLCAGWSAHRKALLGG